MIFQKSIEEDARKYLSECININEIDEEAKVELINKTSLRRIGEPKDISSAAYMLYKSTYITGQIIKVDGGRAI